MFKTIADRRTDIAVWLANLILRTFASEKYVAFLRLQLELGKRELDRLVEEVRNGNSTR